MLKRMVIRLFLVFLLFTGCTKLQIKEAEKKEDTSMHNNFLGVTTLYTINWDNMASDITNQFVFDEQAALSISNIIFTQIKGSEFIDETDFITYELADQDVIVVTRLHRNIMVDGGDYRIAFNKKNGEILKIWIGQ